MKINKGVISNCFCALLLCLVVLGWVLFGLEIAKNKSREHFVIAKVLSVDDYGAYVFNAKEFEDGVAYAKFNSYKLYYYIEVGDEVIIILDDGSGEKQWIIVGWL